MVKECREVEKTFGTNFTANLTKIAQEVGWEVVWDAALSRIV